MGTQERKKSQHWDEMNILSTYHPAEKDYGFMAVDEPDTPYNRRPVSCEETPPMGRRSPLNPTMLADRLASEEGKTPKVIQKLRIEETEVEEDRVNFDFLQKRQHHYDEGIIFRQHHVLSDDDDDDDEDRVGCSSNRNFMSGRNIDRRSI
ncbi:protein phosphatase inhibitor 2-like isoform 2-T2 [Discoglossus pictus]